MAKWERALKNVRKVQTRHLLDFVRHSEHTLYGKLHGFSQIRTWDDYRRQVPVSDYDSLDPLFQRMRNGEVNLVIPEFVQYWGNSSGSTNAHRNKYLPISERQYRFQKGSGIDVLYRFLVNTGTMDYTSGFTMGLFPPPMMKQEGPVLVTNNPALMSARIPRIIQPMWLPDMAIRCIENYDEKLAKIGAAYLDHDVVAVSGTTCWFSILFDKLLAAAKNEGRDVSTVGEIWPNLKVLLGGGVSAAPYLPVIRDRVGRDVYVCDSYNATEGGIFATTDAPDVRGMLMIPDRGVFFEFIPLEEDGQADARRVPLWEVEENQRYVILVTTPSGLFSYRLGDIVQFPSVNPLRLEFAGRLTGNLSTTQELTTHIEIEQSVRAAAQKQPCSMVDFCAGATVGVNGTAKSQYIFFVEWIDAPADAEAFARDADETLCELTRVYREHRKIKVGILLPKVVSLPTGSVRRFMEETGKTSVQTKFPRIVQDPDRDRLLGYASA